MFFNYYKMSWYIQDIAGRPNKLHNFCSYKYIKRLFYILFYLLTFVLHTKYNLIFIY